MSDPWIVNTKGGPGEDCFEISVVREGNSHGRQSLGWFCPGKLLISSSGGPCHNKVSELVWRKLLDAAQAVANEMNASVDNTSQG